MKKIIIYIGLVLFLISTYANARENIKEQFKDNSAIIYTINIRNFASVDNDQNGIIDTTKGEKIGTFLGAKDKLKNLKSEGINTIYVLPITKVGKLKALGTAGSLYAIDSFNQIDEELDEKNNNKTVYEEAREFTEEAHNLGLNVVIDLPSCGSYDLSLKKPSWFMFDKNKEAMIPADWTDVRLFKIYNDNNRGLNQTTLKNFKDFVDMAQSLGFDGIRADVAAIKPPSFWKEIISYARKKDKNFLFLAEANFEWTNPAEGIISHYSTVDELLQAGFDSYYAPWSDFKNIKTKEEFDTKIKNNYKILKRNRGKSTISAFATHDQQAPILKGKNYWNMILWLNATMQSNAYFLDGFSTGDNFIYSYEGKKAQNNRTDDEYYFVHSGMFDIFNYNAPTRNMHPELKNQYLKAIDFKIKQSDLITKGKFKLIKTNNDKVFAYSITNKNKELIVVGSFDETKIQKASVKSKYLEKENLFSLINTKKHPQINQNTLEIELEPLELQVYLINLVNSPKM